MARCASNDTTLQRAIACAQADVVVLVCDGQEGPTAADAEIAAWLRKRHSHAKVVLAVNKCESATRGELQARCHKADSTHSVRLTPVHVGGGSALAFRLLPSLSPACCLWPPPSLLGCAAAAEHVHGEGSAAA
jgi:predicted GTPase